MTQDTPPIVEDESLIGEEVPKVPPVAHKVSKFGPQSGSKFGKNPTQSFQNPIQKGRPGRAAARGR